MEEQHSTIKCPNCGTEINVNDVIYHQLEDQLKARFEADLDKEKTKLEEASATLDKEKKTLEEEKGRIEETIASGLKERMKEEKKRLAGDIRKEIEEEKSEQVSSLREELDRKSGQLKEFNKAKIEIERLKREKDEVESEIQARLEANFSEQLKQERAKVQKVEEEKVGLKIAEKEHLIDELKNQLQEAHRKAEQGSMQLQGEIQELAIEQWLKDQFPLDTIEEVKKGAFGADCMQVVNTRSHQNCGTIYYESKRTKSFQPAWIEKFKADIREKGANMGVLITEALPSDMERMGLKDGIWICTLDEFKGLSFVFRETIIKISNAVATQENKGDKMHMLYDFLTSNEFRLQIEAIVEGFTQMQTDLESEKRSMQGIWKKREKQIQKVLLNTTHMYSSIKGIAGSAIQAVRQLELPEGEEDDE